MGLIRINYSRAIREATRLRAVASDCQTVNTLIDKLIYALPTCWQGSAADAFIEKLTELKQENSSISSEANNLGFSIKRVADEIREAERRAIAAMREE